MDEYELATGDGAPGGSVGELATLPGVASEPSLGRSRPPEPEWPTRIGRYDVRGILGHGGMSVVYAAHDDSLDREVALKVLHRDPRGDEGSRLRREAQALARLSHANVVQVYEVGEFEGRTFIAMELVRGQTLQQWQADKPSWSECVELYLQAGRGLAAAHAVGLVHRDFKPSNCIVDHQGQVRVLDFGLARTQLAEDEPLQDEPPHEEPGSISGPWSVTLTQTGAVLGTLAYMPLEQLNGRPADERSDQFSLCVSLYEAVYGQRPFAGQSAGKLTLSLMNGTVRPAPAGVVAPTRLRRILLRGLATEPDDRWPSMDALLAQLSRLVAPRRTRWVALALAGGLAVMGGGLWQQASARRGCDGAEERLAGIWDDTRRGQVEAALQATALPYIDDTWARAESRLDEYAQAWVSSHVDACEANRRGVQPEAVMSLRMACLSTRRLALGEAVQVLEQADATVAERAVGIVTGLPGPARCDDVEALQAESPPPEDPRVAARVEEVRGQLARLSALVDGLRHDDAHAQLDPVMRDVQLLEHPPLQAEAWLLRGRILQRKALYDEAEQELTRAYALAVEHGHERVAAYASELLVHVVGRQQMRLAEGLQWGVTAMALARRRSSRAVARVLSVQGVVLLQQGDHEAALEHHQQELAIREQIFDAEHPALADSLGKLGNVLLTKGQYAEAEASYQRALEILTNALGPEHPELGITLGHLAQVAEANGQYERALDYVRRSLAIRERAMGSRHPEVAKAMVSMGVILRRQGKLEQARQAYEQALEVFEQTLEPDHPLVGSTLVNLSSMMISLDDPDRALPSLHRGLAIFENSLGPDHPHVALVHDNIGVVLQMLDRYDEALESHRKALAIQERSQEPDHPDRARAMANVGRALLKQERWDEALEVQRQSYDMFVRVVGAEHANTARVLSQIALSELGRGHIEEALAAAQRAWEIYEVSEGDPVTRAGVDYILGKCLWASGPSSKDRARELVIMAQRALAEQGPAAASNRQEVEAWMTEQGIEIPPSADPSPPPAGPAAQQDQ